MNLKITVDAKGLMAALTKEPETLEKNVGIALKEEMIKVIDESRNTHRFVIRTGMLDRSQQMRQLAPMSVEDYLDEGIASYGVYVHEGHGSWKPDRFLYDAFKRHVDSITKAVENAINKTFKQLGLS
jgi:serine/threonine protein kinase HipA of HipAB toxin-antitoxin module